MAYMLQIIFFYLIHTSSAPPHTLLLKWTTAQSFSINLRGSLCFAQSYNIHSFLKDFVITMLGSEQG